MPLVINSNIAALNSQRMLVKSGDDMMQAMERLSSGKRINTAADDAAGLAISNRQTSQILGLNQAVRNANDGISLIQTTEGALDETTNILQRMRELAIQSANGIYSDADRSTLDAEVQQLKQELDRIADTTSFNGQPVLNGTLGDVDLQVGSEANQTIRVRVPSFSSSSLGGAAGDVVGEATTGLAALTGLAGGDELSINGTTISSLASGTSINTTLAIMNSDLNGKGAEVSSLVSIEATNAGGGVLRAPTDRLTITVLDGNGLNQSFTITGTNSMDELVEKINSETGVTANTGDNGKLVLSQAGAQTITLAHVGNSAAATGLAAGATQFSLVITDTSADKNGVTVENAGSLTAPEQLALGIDLNDGDGNLLGSPVGSSAATLADGDLIINGVEIDGITGTSTPATDAASMIVQINEKSSETNVVAYLTATSTIGLRSTAGDIAIEYGNTATPATLMLLAGFQERNALGGSGSVASIDIDTASGAQSSISIIDGALEQINSTRSQLGAINNRLDFTISNLMNVSENTAAARSRIVDADFAAETANLSRAQVLQQASQAMLAQANAQPQRVLQLLNN